MKYEAGVLLSLVKLKSFRSNYSRPFRSYEAERYRFGTPENCCRRRTNGDGIELPDYPQGTGERLSTVVEGE